MDGWRDITAVSAGEIHTLGLRSDGQVASSGENLYAQMNFSGRGQVAALSAGGSHSLWLQADGIVKASGSNKFGQCDVADWIDMRLPASPEAEE